MPMASIMFFFSSRRRHTISYGDWSSDVCSSDLHRLVGGKEHLVEDDDHPLLDPDLGRWALVGAAVLRSEERRVGKECRTRWAQVAEKKKDKTTAADVTTTE